MKKRDLDLNEHADMIRSVAKQVKKLAEPVDLEALEKKGIIKKSGAWYLINGFDNLPESARTRISEVKQDKNGNLKVKLIKQSGVDRLAKKFAKLGL